MMLMVWSRQLVVVAADVMVMPRSLLQLHPVHGGRALMDLTDLVVDAGVEQDPARWSWFCPRRCAP